MLHVFGIRGGKIRLWQATGESYEHVLLKALAYSIFGEGCPGLQVEVKVGLRYKPDLVAVGSDGGFDLWVECGMVSLAKTAWLMKHTDARSIAIFKIGWHVEQYLEHLRAAIAVRYRPAGRLSVYNFVSGITDLTASKQISKVSPDWYSVHAV